MSGTRPRGPAGSRRRTWLPPSTPPGSWVPGGAEQGERGPHLHQRAACREDAARAREPPHEQQREHGERGDLDVVAGQRDVEQERQPGHPQPGACRAAPRPGAGPGEGERDQGVRGEGERDEGLEVGEAGDQAGRQEDGARARRVLPHRVAAPGRHCRMRVTYQWAYSVCTSCATPPTPSGARPSVASRASIAARVASQVRGSAARARGPGWTQVAWTGAAAAGG